MKQILSVFILFIFLLIEGLHVQADPLDREHEKEIADKLSEEVVASEVLQLEANNETFLALLNNQINEKALGAIIILHGMGAHPDWPQTILPIRTAFPDYGWTTLSIQLPLIAPKNNVEDYGKTFERAKERIKAAIRFLHERKFRNIVAIGHSFGAASMLFYLEKEEHINAIAAIGLQNYAFVKPPFDVLNFIEKTKIPILDIYGSRDFKEAVDHAADRRLAAKKGGNNQYLQIDIEGADHYFTKMEDLLIKRIRGWLEKAAPGVSVVVNKGEE